MKRLLTLFIFCTPLLFLALNVQSGIKLIGEHENVNDKFSGEYYGPVHTYESLWSISKKLQPDSGVTIYQTFAAIYKLNPSAFEDGNVDKITAHVTLKVPSYSFIKKQNDRTARILIRQGKRKKSKNVAVKKVKQKPESAPAKEPKEQKEPKELKELKEPKELKEQTKVAELAKADGSEAMVQSPQKTEASELTIALNKQIMFLKTSLELMNEKFIKNNRINESLRIKVENLTKEVKNLNKQLASELAIHEKFSGSNNKYIQDLKSIEAAPFAGEGFVNAILHFITSSVIYLVLALLLPIILLIIIFIFILRKKTKSLSDSKGNSRSESGVANKDVPVNPKSSAGNDSNSMNNNSKEVPLEQEDTNQDESNNEYIEPSWDVEETDQTSELVNLDEKEGLLTEDDLGLSDLDELDTLGGSELNFPLEESPDMDLLSTEEDVNSSDLEIVDADSTEDDFDFDFEAAPDKAETADGEVELTDLEAAQTAPEENFDFEAAPETDNDELDLTALDSEQTTPVENPDLDLEGTPETDDDELDLTALDSAQTTPVEKPDLDLEGSASPAPAPKPETAADELDLTALDSAQTTPVEKPDLDLEGSASPAPAPKPEKADGELSSNEKVMDKNIKSEGMDSFVDIDALLNASMSPGESESAPSNDDSGSALKDKADDESALTEIEETSDGENVISSQLDLARAYLEIDDKSGAKEILDGLSDDRTAKQQEEIDRLLNKLS